MLLLEDESAHGKVLMVHASGKLYEWVAPKGNLKEAYSGSTPGKHQHFSSLSCWASPGGFPPISGHCCKATAGGSADRRRRLGGHGKLHSCMQAPSSPHLAPTPSWRAGRPAASLRSETSSRCTGCPPTSAQPRASSRSPLPAPSALPPGPHPGQASLCRCCSVPALAAAPLPPQQAAFPPQQNACPEFPSRSQQHACECVTRSDIKYPAIR